MSDFTRQDVELLQALAGTYGENALLGLAQRIQDHRNADTRLTHRADQTLASFRLMGSGMAAIWTELVQAKVPKWQATRIVAAFAATVGSGVAGGQRG